MARIVSTTPTNPNPLQISKFQLSFARIPNVVFWCQKVNIPGLTSNFATRNTPFVDLKAPGDKLSFDNLDVEFIVDEDMRSWFEIHDWLCGYSFPKGFSDYATMTKTFRDFGGQYSDATLTIQTAQNIPNIRMIFKDCFPVNLGTINMETSTNADEVPKCSASFAYSYYDVQRFTT